MTRTRVCVLAAGLAMMLGPALAGGSFVFEGTYLQNKPCEGDGSDAMLLRVTITAQEITYAGGVCSIDDKRQDGDRLWMRVTCKFTSGVVVSDNISFTVKDDKTLSMAQQDGIYTSVLNRCPG
jgi:hypothetical protein